MADQPLVTVVIPSYRRPDQLASCLRSVVRSDFPPDRFEVLVVDDGNEEPLDARVNWSAGAVGVRWVRLPENLGPAAARNAGARAARGARLAFIDDDCLADRTWLARLYASSAANDGAAVGGRVVGGSGDNLYCAADQAILDVVFAYYNEDPLQARFLSAASLLVPADAFRESGGFDPAFCTAEDREFCARWLAGGRRLVYAADAVAVHAATSSFGRFWRRHFAFGEGAYRFRSRHARAPDGRIALEPPGFYRRLVSAPKMRPIRAREAAIAALIVVSQLASALGFLAARRAAHTSKGRTA
ncbi:MAG TPA: glycosyltransferase [Vicinamibacterales bacterium]|nr:glycosyltransferase [Vicinamibacterales bacterium]HPW19692.1 glycosyltransferase [Vicinamibacterales bacterium]